MSHSPAEEPIILAVADTVVTASIDGEVISLEMPPDNITLEMMTAVTGI